MRRHFMREQAGQTLALVAVLMVALLAFLAIAIDVGHIYRERGLMQNAADAGALAGAREICFGIADMYTDPTQAVINAEAAAEEYATTNGAEEVDVVVDTDAWTVSVTAQEVADLFVAGIVGMPTADVGATAIASCGGATSLCNIWPISFHWERWQDLECWSEGDPEDQGVFYVFNDNSFDESDPCAIKVNNVCYYYCDGYDENGNLVQQGACECNMIPPDNNAFIIGPGHRGWLSLPEPEEPYEDPLSCTTNCGSNQVRCWIQNDGYSGELELPDGDFCLPGQTGVDENIRIEIERYHIGDTPNILIWDRECTEDEPVTGECSGTPYHIITTGCVEILDTPNVDLLRKAQFQPPNNCESNVKVIKARRLCDCESACGSTGGGPPDPGEVRSVSLTQ